MAERIHVRTTEREQLVDITDKVRALVHASGVATGVIHLWSLHTTCALTVNEGADPDVARDIVVTMRKLIPHKGDYKHVEGNSDSHLKTAFFGPGCTLLIENADLLLGTWQHVFLAEWDGPRPRDIAALILSASATPRS